LDSSDLDAASRAVRAALNAHGYSSTKIMGSGHLDEHSIAALSATGAPIDRYAVGRALARVTDEEVRMAFRIAERQTAQGGIGVRGEGAARWPGRKQVIRTAAGDTLVRASDAALYERSGGVGLLAPVQTPAVPLAASRDHCARAVGALPAGVRAIRDPDPWPVSVGDGV
jgi:nicotinate phosphoribosyltransferase